MTVATYDPPDFNTMTDASEYKSAIDGGMAVHNEVAGNFAPHESATPDMKVVIDAGKLFTALLIVKAQQTTTTLVAPVTNPRINRIAIDTNTGDIVVIAGTEAASPVAPDYSLAHYPVCQFQLETSTTQIFNSMIVDERGLIYSPNIIQVVNTISSGMSTGTDTFPFDDTLPVNTDGNQFMSLAITPKSSTNKLKIEILMNLSSSNTTGHMNIGLFQDSTVNALAAVFAGRDVSADAVCQIALTHYMDAGTTSETTFKARAANANSGTTTFNGNNAARIFGGVMASSITITEIKG